MPTSYSSAAARHCHHPAPSSSRSGSVALNAARVNARQEMNRLALYVLLLATAAFAFIALTAVFVSAGAASDAHTAASAAAAPLAGRS